MSSKDIAQKTKKAHGHVLRDIRIMLEALYLDSYPNLDSPEFQILKDAQSGLTSEILLNEKMSLCLASGYSIPLRMMIIEAWAELKKPKELSKKEILLIALEAEERAELAESKVKLLEPKAKFYDTVVNTNDTFDFSQVAKMIGLGYGSVTLFKKLRERGVLNRDNVPYQQYVNYKYFEVKQSKYSINDVVKVHVQTRFTEKGVKWLVMNKEKL